MKHIILTLSLLSALQVQANTGNTMDPSVTTPATQLNQAAAGHSALLFDHYVAESGLQAVDATTGSQTAVLLELGNQLIVAAAPAKGAPIAATDTVVRNTLTGELGILTGRLQLVANSASVLKTLTERFALKPVNSLRGGKVQLVEAPAGTDLVKLLQQLRLEPGVQAARLDVLENLHTPQ